MEIMDVMGSCCHEKATLRLLMPKEKSQIYPGLPSSQLSALVGDLGTASRTLVDRLVQTTDHNPHGAGLAFRAS